MSETQFQVGDFVVFDHNVDGPIYEVERLDEMFIVIRDENDDLQSVDPATLTLYGRRGLLTESLGSVARKSARIAELERENAELREQLTAVARYFDGFNLADFEAAFQVLKEFENQSRAAVREFTETKNMEQS